MTSITLTYLDSKAKVGDTVYVGVVVDSGDKEIDGIDVEIFTTTKLKPTSYVPTHLMPVPIYTNILPSGIMFSQICKPGQPMKVKGLIAVIVCTAVAKGTAALKIKFTKGSTTDSNMASDGKDILDKVINKSITIS